VNGDLGLTARDRARLALEAVRALGALEALIARPLTLEHGERLVGPIVRALQLLLDDAAFATASGDGSPSEGSAGGAP
jgi:hypothetical protein